MDSHNQPFCSDCPHCLQLEQEARDRRTRDWQLGLFRRRLRKIGALGETEPPVEWIDPYQPTFMYGHAGPSRMFRAIFRMDGYSIGAAFLAQTENPVFSLCGFAGSDGSPYWDLAYEFTTAEQYAGARQRMALVARLPLSRTPSTP